MANVLNITACDNELIIMAYQANASFELCKIKSGYDRPVNVTMNIVAGQYQGSMYLNGVNIPLQQTITQMLPIGAYSLVMLGIDWGGPAKFAVNVNGTPYEVIDTTPANGLVFSPDPITINV